MMRKRVMIQLAGALFAVVILAGCGADQDWRTDNITGLMPDLKFTLTNQNGRRVQAQNFHRKLKLLYFGYTNCPDVCPLTLATINRALGKLGKKAKQVRVLFVSVDPKRDTPKVLREYTQAFGPQFTGLTGTQAQLKALTKRYRVVYSYSNPTKNGNYTVNHSSSIYVFGERDKVHLLMKYTDGPNAMAHDLKQLLD